jgi:hypothetical protein
MCLRTTSTSLVVAFPWGIDPLSVSRLFVNFEGFVACERWLFGYTVMHSRSTPNCMSRTQINHRSPLAQIACTVISLLEGEGEDESLWKLSGFNAHPCCPQLKRS